MSVSRINSSYPITFGSNEKKEKEAIKTETPSKTSFGGKKILLALGGLAVLGAGAVIYAKNRKAGGALEEKNRKILKAFDEKGIKFVKGKAMVGEKGYTGMVVHRDTQKEKFIMEYVDGLITRSTKESLHGTIPTIKDYEYVNGKLSKLVKDADSIKSVTTTFTENGASRTVNWKDELIREIQVKANGTLKYDSDVIITKPNNSFYDSTITEFYKGKKRYATESARAKYDMTGVYKPDNLQKELPEGTTYRTVETLFEDGVGIVKERVYSNGAKDVIVEGDFNDVNHLIKYLDENGSCKGFRRSTFVAEEARRPDGSGHGIQMVTDKVRIETFDKDMKKTGSWISNRTSEDLSHYDWN